MNCWLVGDQIELLFEDSIVGDLMMMELLAITARDRLAGGMNELMPPMIELLATNMHFCRQRFFEDGLLPICPQGSNY